MKFLKELYEINNFYWKERRIIWNVISLTFLFAMLGIGILTSQYTNFIFLEVLLYFGIAVLFTIILSTLIFKQTEKYLQSIKKSDFKNFLEKLISFETNIRRKYVIRLLLILLTLFLLIILILLFNSSSSSVLFPYGLSIIGVILAFQVQYLIHDVTLIIKKKFKN